MKHKDLSHSIELKTTDREGLKHILEMEKIVLGLMMAYKEAAAKSIAGLSEDAFYSTMHRKIFRAATDLFKRNEPIKVTTVTRELIKRKELSKKLGEDAEYITILINYAPVEPHIDYYVNIVNEQYVSRKLVALGYELINKGQALDMSNIEIIDFCQKELNNIIGDIKSKGWKDKGVKDLIAQKITDAKNGKVAGLSSGYLDLDAKIGGFQAGKTYIIAGKTSMGKTAFTLNILYNLLKSNVPVGLFSLEATYEEVMERIIAIDSGVDLGDLTANRLEEKDFVIIEKSGDRIDTEYAPIFVNDDKVDLVTLELLMTRMVRAGAKLIAVDYLQLVTGEKLETREREVSSVSMKLKELAKKLNIPIIALAQLSRAVETRKEKTPVLADLRESGTIENDADVVLLLYRDEYYNPKSIQKNILEVNVAKNRSGKRGVIKLAFFEENIRVRNLSERQE